MEPWKEDLVHSFQTIECERQVFAMAAELARGLGFDYYTYGLRTPIPLTRPKTAMYSNYPLAWQTIYQEKEYLVIDPTVQQAIRSLSPILWSDDLFAPTPELWEEAQSFGLRAGLAQICRDADGMTGLLVLARSGEAVTTTEWQTKACHIMWLVQAVHLCMARIVAPKLMPALAVKLCQQEAEVLRWTGDGKTSGEIADILQLSERTVNFHISKVITKLQVNNKTAAVLRAAMLGLL
ncbi:autoinducer binding domain-containing protein [Acidithiobacillus ferrivorans]|uniref:autoinducer binding domain-containing protein n=1 Tax=Acidithiobacillus ferrivorans TaxID=160808 RepID=UPI001C065F42|nr:autoinducer binding domain-containing protein [Acidithiobacillus ferrivorans]MBU2849949.1 LuxR family transcriptional regulator [Acidithiobacillus ferrivorans]